MQSRSKLIKLAGSKKAGGRCYNALNYLGSPGCSVLTLPAPGFLRMRQGAVPGRSILGGAPCAPPAPAPSNQGAGGGMLGAGMQGCQATAASPCPVPPQPRPPPGAGLRSARAAGAVKQPRGAPQHGARLPPRAPATAPLPAVPGAIASSGVRIRKAVNE